jgi:putative ABC transport system ATP-binding protein
MLGNPFRNNGSGNGNGNGNGKSNGHYRNGNDHLIELRDVVKTYRSAAGEFTALKGIALEVDRGEFVAVIGKSGSGKSTLMNMITGIDRPTSGEILVGDTAIQALHEGKLAEWRGRNVGVIFQFFQLLPTLTVAENVMLPMDFCHMYSLRERRERAIHLLEQVGVADQADKLPSTLSGGQQQRVAIARALANDPPILAADEPTGNLDSKTAGSVFGLFETLVAQGKTILMVTHDRDLARRASRTVILSDGEVVEDCPAKTGVGADRVLGVEVAAADRASFEGMVAGPATIREGIDRRVVERAADHETGQPQRGNGHV